MSLLFFNFFLPVLCGYSLFTALAILFFPLPEALPQPLRTLKNLGLWLLTSICLVLYYSHHVYFNYAQAETFFPIKTNHWILISSFVSCAYIHWLRIESRLEQQNRQIIDLMICSTTGQNIVRSDDLLSLTHPKLSNDTLISSNLAKSDEWLQHAYISTEAIKKSAAVGKLTFSLDIDLWDDVEDEVQLFSDEHVERQAKKRRQRAEAMESTASAIAAADEQTFPISTAANNFKHNSSVIYIHQSSKYGSKFAKTSQKQTNHTSNDRLNEASVVIPLSATSRHVPQTDSTLPFSLLTSHTQTSDKPYRGSPRQTEQRRAYRQTHRQYTMEQLELPLEIDVDINLGETICIESARKQRAQAATVKTKRKLLLSSNPSLV